jgi:hypothetical protein
MDPVKTRRDKRWGSKKKKKRCAMEAFVAQKVRNS